MHFGRTQNRRSEPGGMAPRPEKLIAFRAADSDCKSQHRTLSSASRRDIIRSDRTGERHRREHVTKRAVPERLISEGRR
jgi:hypothetical protein